MLYEDLAGWAAELVGVQVEKEGIYVYLWLIHAVVRQKLTQHCEAIILQLKVNKKKEEWINTKRS